MVDLSQINIWKSKFGKDYTKRNFYDKLENSYIQKFGCNKEIINNDFINYFDKDYSFLEVGCNIGNELKILKKSGFKKLTGIDTQKHAIEIARSNLKSVEFIHGNAENLPFEDNTFDVVFTNNLLIHLNSKNLITAIKEMKRITKKYIWSFEYYFENRCLIEYHDHMNLLWKDDFKKYFLEIGFEITKNKKYKYISSNESGNIDEMFLLEKILS